MRLRVAAAALALVGIAGCAEPPTVIRSDFPLAIGQRLAQIRLISGAPAVAAMLVRDGRVVEQGAVGVRKVGDTTRVQGDDPWHLGSDTKAMTATLVAMQVDRGALSWTSTLGELLPEITTMDPAYRAVTIEMLLAHRAGLGAESTFDEGRLFAALRAPGLDPVEGRTMLARAMLSSPPATVPGTAFAYSNAGYVIVGAILEKRTGQRWESLMRDLLFAPLGMTGCGFGALGDAGSAIAGAPWGHEQTEAGLRPVVLDNPATLGPAATVHCPLAAWMKFVTLHMDAFDGRPRLVSAAGFAKMHTPYPGQGYTPGGWMRVDGGADGPVFTHNGSNTLNFAIAWWAPARRTAIVAASNAGIPAGQRAAQLALFGLQAEAGQR